MKTFALFAFLAAGFVHSQEISLPFCTDMRSVINTSEAQKFQEDFDAKYFEINRDFEKLRHVLLHLVKTTGKMATYCEVMEHGKVMPDSSQLVNEVLPDLLVHALQIANYYQVDLGKKYKERLQFVEKRAKATP